MKKRKFFVCIIAGFVLLNAVLGVLSSKARADDLVDPDEDGLTIDYETTESNTDPNDPDTDNDGLYDGWHDEPNDDELWEPGEELGEVGSPTQSFLGGYGTEPLDTDTDDDGLWDGWHDDNQNLVYDPGEELGEVGDQAQSGLGGYLTNPTVPDTDGDGLLDGEEVNADGATGLTITEFMEGSVPYTISSLPETLHVQVPDNDFAMEYVESTSMVLEGVLAGTGDWDDRITREVGKYPNELDVGDANNDGYNDVVATGQFESGRGVSILLWNPVNQDWDPHIDKTVPTGYPYDVVIADADNDGDNDIVVASTYASGVDLFRWNELTFDWDYETIPTQFQPSRLDVGDADTDGDNDIAVITYTSGFPQYNCIEILLWTGSTWLDYTLDNDIPTSLRDIAIGDANNDDWNDIALTYQKPSSPFNVVWVYAWNPGGMTWDFPIEIPITGSWPYSIEVEDADNDGDNDIAFGYEGGAYVGIDWYHGVGVLLWNGVGWDPEIFLPVYSEPTFPVGGKPGFDVGDADNDCDNDIIYSKAAFNRVFIFKWEGSDWAPFVKKETGDAPLSARIGDVDNDGDNDIAVGDYYDSDVSFLLWRQGYPSNPSLDVGHDRDYQWSFNGPFNQQTEVDDFSNEINVYITSHGDDDDDFPGSGFIEVPFVFGASSHGGLKIRDLEIIVTILVTDPLDPDTDGDGLLDGEEYNAAGKMDALITALSDGSDPKVLTWDIPGEIMEYVTLPISEFSVDYVTMGEMDLRGILYTYWLPFAEAPEGTDWTEVYRTCIAAQSFFVVADVNLALELYLGKVGIPADDLTVEIWSNAGVEPEPPPTWTATIEESQISTDPSWVEVPFDYPVQLSGGNIYWVVLSSPLSTDPLNSYLWFKCIDNPYPNGVAAYSDDGGLTWTISDMHDYSFKAYHQSYPINPDLDVGDDGDSDWSYDGEFMTKERAKHLNNDMNEYISTRDQSADSMDVPLVFRSDSIGQLELSNIAIHVGILVTNPMLWDTDGDGLGDGDEIYIHFTNPLDIDTDDDRLTDEEEVNTYGTDPCDADTDDDGFTDGEEILVYESDPIFVLNWVGYFVMDDIFPEIASDIEDYVANVEKHIGISTNIFVGSWTRDELKAELILHHGDGMRGAVFVGHAPAAIYYCDDAGFGSTWGDEKYPIDLYYEDLDGEWGELKDYGSITSERLNGVADSPSSGNIFLLVGDNGMIMEKNAYNINGPAAIVANPTFENLYSVDFSTSSSALIVGDSGRVLKYESGSLLPPLTTAPAEDLRGVDWNLDAPTPYALIVGKNGIVFKYDEISGFTLLASGTIADLMDVEWRNDYQYALIVGEGGTVLKYDGAVFTPLISGTFEDLNAVSWNGDDTCALIVGDGGTILRFIPESFDPLFSGTLNNLNGVDWRAESDYWSDFWLIVGDGGTVLKSDGTTVELVVGGSTSNLYSVVCDAYYGAMVMVGDNGAFQNHYQFASHTSGPGDVSPEIWVGQLRPPRASDDIANTVSDLIAYFQRAIAYMSGTLVSRDSALMYPDNDWDDYPIYIYYRHFDGTSWTTEEMISGSTDSFPDVAFANDKVHVIYRDRSTGIIWYRYHDGIAWQPEQQISAGSDECQPAIAAEDDKVYVVWQEYVGPRSVTKYRHFDGSTWQPEEVVWTDPSNSQTEPSITVENEEVFVAWVNKGFSDSTIRYRHKVGDVWEDMVEISQDTSSGKFDIAPSIAVDSGEVHIVWERYKNEDGDIFYRHSDDGVAWVEDERSISTFEGWQRTPCIAAENGKLYVVWEGHIDGDWDIYYTNYNGVEWATEMEISTDADHEGQYSSAIDVENEDIYVVWRNDKQNGDWDIHFRGKSDCHWGVEQVLSLDPTSEKPQDFPEIDVENGLIYVVWSEYSTGHFTHKMNEVYDDYTMISRSRMTNSVDYSHRVENEYYEFIHVKAHSSESGHSFSSWRPGNTWLSASEIHDMNQKALFYLLFACSNARYIPRGAVPPDETLPGYMAGEYAFGDTDFGLAGLSSTKTGGMLGDQYFYDWVNRGFTLGTAWLAWFRDYGMTSNSAFQEAWFSGMAFIGDPVLRTSSIPKPLFASTIA